MKTRLLACSIGLLAMTSAPAAMANLINGDFDPDFDGWSGETIDAVDDVQAANPDTSPLFQILGGGLAELTTDPTGNNFYNVALFQAFDVPGDVTTIEIEGSWSLTDFAGGDLAEIVLTNTANTLDSELLFEALTDSGTFSLDVDISSYANKNVQLLFRVEDGGDDGQDSFTFGNIVVNQTAAPAPTTIALLGLGALGLARRRRRG